MQLQTKVTPILSENKSLEINKSEISPAKDEHKKIIDFEECIEYLNQKGKEIFGKTFLVDSVDYEVIFKILVYTIKDEKNARKHKIDLNKGILLSGPIGCGKTSLMKLINFINTKNDRYMIKSCREVSYDFISHGYQVLHDYSYQSFINRGNVKVPKVWCFDDLGTENNLKYYGNECNVMAEILLSRYDLFIQKDMLTHLTTNLTAQEIENLYGNRVRSRMREMFNLISFNSTSKDKRV